jgi:hypothetical protein
MIEGSGSGSIPLTSGSGSLWPKNMWIRIRIRIRNTACEPLETRPHRRERPGLLRNSDHRVVTHQRHHGGQHGRSQLLNGGGHKHPGDRHLMDEARLPVGAVVVRQGAGVDLPLAEGGVGEQLERLVLVVLVLQAGEQEAADGLPALLPVEARLRCAGLQRVESCL